MPEKSRSNRPMAPPVADRFRDMMVQYTIPPAITNQESRKEKYGLPTEDDAEGDYIIELNLTYTKGMKQAGSDFRALYANTLRIPLTERPPLFVSKSYFKCVLTVEELQKLVAADQIQKDLRHRLIYKVWPDFPITPLIDQSVSTVKADAAIRAYAATGKGIVWAVIDSGVEGKHIHFGSKGEAGSPNNFCCTLSDPSVASLHRDFTASGGVPQSEDFPCQDDVFSAAIEANIASALVDGYGHGTHVAGIIAGGLDEVIREI